MQIKFFIIFTVCVAIFAGCAAKPIQRDSSTRDTSVRNNGVRIFSGSQEQTFELLSFCESYSNLTPEAQKKTYAATTQALATNKNDLVQRAKQAIMLALPSSRLRDTVRAQNLLQDLLQEGNLSGADSDLIGLLYEYTIFDNKQIQKLRDESKRHEQTQQKYEALQQKNETLQQRSDALEQKLNDLKNIEKTMNERSTKADGKP